MKKDKMELNKDDREDEMGGYEPWSEGRDSADRLIILSSIQLNWTLPQVS
jgi:hypothetical protein